MKNLKRILALIGVILILLWVIATLVIAIIPAGRETGLFPIFLAGCVIFPIMLWIILWLVGVITHKKNIASFRSEEMEETMRLADEIRNASEGIKETDSDPINTINKEESVQEDQSVNETNDE